MTPAALAANKANAQKAGRPRGKISLSDISFRDRCRVRDEEHIAILEHIARYSENEGFRLAAIRDLFDRGRGRPRVCFSTERGRTELMLRAIWWISELGRSLLQDRAA